MWFKPTSIIPTVFSGALHARIAENNITLWISKDSWLGLVWFVLDAKTMYNAISIYNLFKRQETLLMESFSDTFSWGISNKCCLVKIMVILLDVKTSDTLYVEWVQYCGCFFWLKKPSVHPFEWDYSLLSNLRI